MGADGRPSIIATVLAAAALVAGLGACSDSHGAPADGDFSDRYLASLIGASNVDDNEEVMTEYLRYEEESIAECMHGAGYDYVAAPPESIFIPLGYTGDLKADAEHLGFGISTIDANVEAESTNPNDAIVSSLHGAESAAWNDQYVRCADAATEEMTDQRGVGAAASIAVKVNEAIRTDEGVRAAQQEWSVCMGQRGFETSSREDLISRMTAEFATLPPTDVPSFRQREIAAALADVECGENLRRVQNDAMRTYLQELSPESYAQLFP